MPDFLLADMSLISQLQVNASLRAKKKTDNISIRLPFNHLLTDGMDAVRERSSNHPWCHLQRPWHDLNVSHSPNAAASLSELSLHGNLRTLSLPKPTTFLSGSDFGWLERVANVIFFPNFKPMHPSCDLVSSAEKVTMSSLACLSISQIQRGRRV